MKKILLLLVVSLIAFGANAQKLVKAYTALNNNQLSQAEAMFQKAYLKQVEVTAARYGLAKLLENPSYHAYNEYNAFKYYRIIYDTRKRVGKQDWQMYKDAYNISIEQIMDNMCNLASNQFETIKQKSDKEHLPTHLKNFIVDYQGADCMTKKAQELLEEVEYQRIVVSGDIMEYRQYAKDYPNSKYIDAVMAFINKDMLKAHDIYYNTGYIVNMQNFNYSHPDYKLTHQDSVDMANAMVGQALKLEQALNPKHFNKYLEYIELAAPKELAYFALRKIFSVYYAQNKLDSAVYFLKKYQPLFPNHAIDIDKTIDIATAKKSKVEIKEYDMAINNNMGEQYAPFMTADSKKMYFCAKNRADNLGGEDVYVSQKVNGKWLPAKLIKELCSISGNEAPLSISPDGNQMLFFKNGDIHNAKMDNQGNFSTIRKVNFLNDYSSWNADAFHTFDGNAILFASDRHNENGPTLSKDYGPWGGNIDIWVCLKDKNGDWGKPINLGNVINTPFNERSPYLASDMRTLYFSSNGHYGLGGLDVYMSVRLSDTSWTQWSEPVNIGKQFNTASTDWGFHLASDGIIAYFAKNIKQNSNKQKLCYAILPEELRPQPIASIEGKITDSKGNILQATIVWEDLQQAKKLGELECDYQTGEYFITLPNGKNYGYYASCPGYYPTGGNVFVNTSSKIRKDIILYSMDEVKNGKNITLNNLFFDVNKFELKTDSYPELQRLCKFLEENPSLKIEISGHTDNTGNASANQTLSQNRADAVKSYLLKIGISASRITSVGKGSSEPKASNSTIEGKSLNRRVEFKVL